MKWSRSTVWCWPDAAVTHDHTNPLVCPFACLFVHSCSISSRINRPTSQENRWSLWQSCYCYSQLQTMPACWSPQSLILRCLQPLVTTPSAAGGQGVLRPSIVRVGCVLIYENTIVWCYDTSTGLLSSDEFAFITVTVCLWPCAVLCVTLVEMFLTTATPGLILIKIINSKLTY